MTEETKAWLLSQEETAYIPLSTTRGKACANCRWFNPNGTWQDELPIASCHLVDCYPEPILATGYCNRHESKPVPVEPEIEAIPVVIVEPPMEMDDSGMMRALSEPGVFERILARLKTALFGEPKTPQFKSLGNGLWLAWYTNNAEDREGEILAEAAHDRYVRRVQSALVPMPILEFWHIPGTRHGKALWVDRIGHSMLAVGEYDDSPLAKAMRDHYENDKPKYAMSHGFTADKNKHFKDGVWWDYNTHEVSTLPVWAAANVLTLFEEQPAMASEQSLAALTAILENRMGKEAASVEMQRIEAESKARDKAITEMGRYKDYTDPANLEQPTQDMSKSFGELMLDLMQAQADTAQIMKGMSAQLESVTAALSDRESVIKGLQAQLALQPRASQAAVTAITNADLEAKLKEALPGEEYDPMFGSMKVKKAVR